MNENRSHEQLADTTQSLLEVAEITGRDSDAFFSIMRGSSQGLIEQLIKKSHEPTIARFCPNDSLERFSTTDSFEVWKMSKGGRTPYFLTDGDGELAGMVWYGPSKFPAPTASHLEVVPNHTFAIRLYEGSEGKGLARPFIKETIKDYVQHLADSNQLDTFYGIHLQTDADNPSSIPLYHKVGYEDVRTDENGRITMVLSPEKIHEICSN